MNARNWQGSLQGMFEMPATVSLVEANLLQLELVQGPRADQQVGGKRRVGPLGRGSSGETGHTPSLTPSNAAGWTTGLPRISQQHGTAAEVEESHGAVVFAFKGSHRCLHQGILRKGSPELPLIPSAYLPGPL